MLFGGDDVKELSWPYWGCFYFYLAVATEARRSGVIKVFMSVIGIFMGIIESYVRIVGFEYV